MAFVVSEIDHYRYELHPDAIGDPWPADKVDAALQEMRRCLVDPYPLIFLIHDTWEEIHADPQIKRELWVVAEDETYKLFYDPEAREFGLGQQGVSGEWLTIGVRGDAVGCFLAR